MKGPMLLLALAGALAGVGCEEKKTSSDARTDAGADKYASADPKLSKALQAAASATAAETNGPPPEGIFPAGVADQRHPQGMPTKVDVVSDGAAPQISLGGSADAGANAALVSSYGPVMLNLAMQMGQRSALPLTTLDLAVLVGPPVRKEDGGAGFAGRRSEARASVERAARDASDGQ